MTRILVAFSVAALLNWGCAATSLLVGAEMHDSGAPEDASAILTAPVCESLRGGKSVAGPAGVKYHLMLGLATPSLYELDDTGSGARILNHWADADGYHFFSYVATSGAWHYVFPKDATQTAMRYAYETNGTWSTIDVDGVIKPTGTPAWKCPLIKQ
jgi:hypothetical protein